MIMIFDIYTIVKWYLQAFFSVFKNFREAKGQNTVQNDKKFCLWCLIPQEPCIILLSFMVHMCKRTCSKKVPFLAKAWHWCLHLHLHCSKFDLKPVSAIFYQFLFFHQVAALWKLWKMLSISSKKLFSFLRYSNFHISLLPSSSPYRLLL